ncbi:MAG: DUF2341 domain-containing protein, partial [Gammaproteobacteria bacterium]|nr:DUF2341 domain-containing protein [Gammaproteobacteria bacterium]
MRKLITTGFSLLLFAGTDALLAAPLTYGIPVTITNPGEALTQFQVNITFDTATLIAQEKMKGNCDDMRILDKDGITDIPYWVESGCNSLETQIWLKIPFLNAYTDTTIFISYGDPTVGSLSNAEDVFDFYDTFSGNSLDTAKWSLVINDGYSYSVKANQLVFDTAGLSNRTIKFDSNYIFKEDIVIEKKSYISDTYGITGQLGHALHWYTGKLLIATPGLSNTTDQGINYPRGSNVITQEVYNHANQTAQACYNLNCTASYITLATDTNLALRVFDHSNSSSATDMFKVDWVRVRKHSPLALVIHVGLEEVSPLPSPGGVETSGDASSALATEMAILSTEINNIDTSGFSFRDVRRLNDARKLFLSAQAYIAVGDIQKALSELDNAVDEIIRMRATNAEYLYEAIANIT